MRSETITVTPKSYKQTMYVCDGCGKKSVSKVEVEKCENVHKKKLCLHENTLWQLRGEAILEKICRECHYEFNLENISLEGLGDDSEKLRRLVCEILRASDSQYDQRRTVLLGAEAGPIVHIEDDFCREFSPELWEKITKEISPETIYSRNKIPDYIRYGNNTVLFEKIDWRMDVCENFLKHELKTELPLNCTHLVIIEGEKKDQYRLAAY